MHEAFNYPILDAFDKHQSRATTMEPDV